QLRLRSCGISTTGCSIHACSTKHNLLTVSAECVRILGRRMKRESCGSTAGCRHHIHIEVAVTIAGERNGPAIRTPHRHEVVCSVRSERCCNSARDWHTKQVSLVGEHEGLTIRRDGRISEPGSVLCIALG